ncbi:unnamed protein product [Cylindrotheca closterium]|uniref:Uncharacterized protein n=1 Tax=Cylindrotheca closterium TaxID=2856 RepID=A0AAD2PWY3_9STRA|nr:unnamed protein product [Cylindrotheca closterium]
MGVIDHDPEKGEKSFGYGRPATTSVARSESPSDDDKELETYHVGEDVYGLIFVCPVFSQAFFFAFLVVMVKFSLFLFLLVDLYRQSQGGEAFFAPKDTLIRATEFLLLPIAIALQEDLIYVYIRVANIIYDPKLMNESPSATKCKFVMSFVLRLMDGLFSLTINFVLIMTTETVLGIFLNFAALHFLQGIDDVAFQMAHEGFLGDRMEYRCQEVQQTKMKRRVGDAFTNALDSVLFLLTYFCMLGVWTYVYLFEEQLQSEL